MSILKKLYQSLQALPPVVAYKKLRVQNRAILFAVLVCISIVSLVGYGAGISYHAELQEARASTLNMNRSFAQHADDTFKAVDSVLHGIVDRVQVYGIDSARDAQFTKFLQVQTSEMTAVEALLVFNAEGLGVASSQAKGFESFSISDRKYFLFHKNNVDEGAHIGLPVQSRGTGRWVIPVSRRISNSDGTFAGLALASIRVDFVRDYHETFEIGAKGTIFLALDNGTMVVRRPFAATDIGKDISQGPVFTNIRRDGPGSALLTAKIDGVERLYSYSLLPHYPVVVATALSKNEILSGWRREVYRAGSAVAMLLTLLGGVALHLIRQIGARVKAEQELREAKASLEALNQSLEKLSLQDGLTGLGNRRHFDLSLSKEVKRGRRNKTSLALVLLDVDHFKRFNDMYGHLAGDECLRQVSEAIKNTCNRATDIPTRYGGEEMAILLPQGSLQSGWALAERVRLAVESLAIPHAGSPRGIVTISLGVSESWPSEGRDVENEIVHEADQALYQAKAAGRNRVCVNKNSGKVPLVA